VAPLLAPVNQRLCRENGSMRRRVIIVGGADNDPGVIDAVRSPAVKFLFKSHSKNHNSNIHKY
jgi:hypothetical protein